MSFKEFGIEEKRTVSETYTKATTFVIFLFQNKVFRRLSETAKEEILFNQFINIINCLRINHFES